MEPLERAELLLAKAKDDETLLEEVISNRQKALEIVQQLRKWVENILLKP